MLIRPQDSWVDSPLDDRPGQESEEKNVGLLITDSKWHPVHWNSKKGRNCKVLGVPVIPTHSTNYNKNVGIKCNNICSL